MDAAPGADVSPGGDAAPGADSGGKDAWKPGKTAADWIKKHFAAAPVLTGAFTSRTTVETPRLVINATGGNAKYAFDVRDKSAPNTKEAGFVNVSISKLISSDAYGAGIVTGDPGMVLYLAKVQIEPDWPTWQGYSTTNKDGVVLDGSKAFYAEDLTIKKFNADSAIDNKAPLSQMVRLIIDSPGHRSIRYWGKGPHYLVDSSITNPGTAGNGTLLWFKDCSSVQLYVYNTTFNGASKVPGSKIDCDSGSSPQITYLSKDPRTTGEMHPMFVAP